MEYSIFPKAFFIQLIFVNLCIALPGKRNDHQLFFEINDEECGKNLCCTPQCVVTAGEVLKMMNESANPCENFYDFACGGYVQEAVVSKSDRGVGTIHDMQKHLSLQLKVILEEEISDKEIRPFQQIKKYYQICMNTTEIEKTGEETILNVFNELGGFPAIQNTNWSENKFSWMDTAVASNKMGIDCDFFFKFSVVIDPQNLTNIIIQFGSPDFPYFDHKHLKDGRNNSNVIASYEYIRDIAILLGADPETASKEMSDMIDFEIKLASITQTKENRRNATLLYNPIALNVLQKKYTWLDWFGYINDILPPGVTIDENEALNIVDMHYFEEIGELLQNTSKRTIANFMLGRVAAESVKYLTSKLRTRQQEFYKIVYGQAEEEARWKKCIFDIVHDNLLVSAMYVRRHFNRSSIKPVEEIAQEIKQEFENLFRNTEWLDSDTRQQAIEKLLDMVTLIGCPDELYQDEALIQRFENLTIETTSFLQNHYKLIRFEKSHSYKLIREPFDRTNWTTWENVAQVNAFYDPSFNSAEIPAGILQGHFFTLNRPKYLNFAAIGSVIGHEFTHGFDSQELLHPNVKDAFQKKVNCIINQYSSTVDAQTNMTLNGFKTQHDDIADNGGNRLAYSAFEQYVKKHGNEKLLPGLKYNQRQLFWIALSQNFCSKYTTDALIQQRERNPHSPGKYRVLIPLKNNEEFAKDFQCPEGSPMNPVAKCRVW